MKTCLVIFIIISSAIQLLSQDIKDPQALFNPNDSIFSDVLNRDINEFILGWNWASIDSNLDKALLMDYYHTNRVSFSHSFPWGQKKIFAMSELGSGNDYPCMFQAPAIQFDPEIEVVEDYNFSPRFGDNTGAIFGFKYRNFNVGDTATIGNENFNRFILSKANYPTDSNRIVILDHIWPQNHTIDLSYQHREQSNPISWMSNKDTMNATQWYISINLRSLEEINELNEDDTVLTIKLPYKLGESSNVNFILFSEDPRDGLTPQDTHTIFANRSSGARLGFSRRLRAKTENRTEFNITGNMLKVNSEGIADSNITLSAFFITDSNIVGVNPFLQSDRHGKGKASNRISKLGITVYYHGTIDCAIDWIRFETPHARRFLWGDYDDDIIEDVQEQINKYNSEDATQRGIRLFRFNTIIEGSMFNWIAEKYFNKLVGNIGTSEVGGIFPAHYEEYVNGIK